MNENAVQFSALGHMHERFPGQSRRFSIGYILYHEIVPSTVRVSRLPLSTAKWIMKQYWRIGQTRALLSLALSMFVIGKVYYEFFPLLADWGLLGALTLGTALIFLFLGLGWFYDERMKMWGAKYQTNAERNPYRYVPDPRNYAIDYPATFAAIYTLKDICAKNGFATDSMDRIARYLDDFYGFRECKKDMRASEIAAEKLRRSHSFSNAKDNAEPTRLGFRERIKIRFEIQMLRLNWIQALTSIFQDALVFAGAYVTILYAGYIVDGALPLEWLFQGLVFLALPVFLAIAVLGWVYDKKLKVWSADSVVKVERNPYTYVPDPRMYLFFLPFYYTLFETLRDILVSQSIDKSEIDKILTYLDDFGGLTVMKDTDMRRARELRAAFGVAFGVDIEQE